MNTFQRLRSTIGCSFLALLAFSLVGHAVAANLKIIVPASAGGGWDQLGRATQQSMQAAKLAEQIQVSNVPGAGGTIGLATLHNTHKGDPNALMVSGKGMLSAIVINKSPIDLSQVVPIARLTGEYEVIVVPTESKIKSMVDLIAQYKANPGSVSWGGGLAGGVDMLTAGMIIQAIGGDASKLNYVAFGGGGEVLTAAAGGHITAGVGGHNEFAQQIKAGKLRALGITSDKRLAGVDIPTLKEQGINVEFINWRGLMAPAGISDAQRQEMVKKVTEMSKSEQWRAILAKNDWTDLFLAGDDFKSYVETEQKNVQSLVNTLGLVKK
jgi:putative tricarboxylic transport membrane protein